MVSFEWSRQAVRVNHYYFYLQDADFGPAFIKICSYVPYAIKVYLNGHEWAKQQLRKAGIAFEALDNGFLSCAEPEQWQTDLRLAGAGGDRSGVPEMAGENPAAVAEGRSRGWLRLESLHLADGSESHADLGPAPARP